MSSMNARMVLTPLTVTSNTINPLSPTTAEKPVEPGSTSNYSTTSAISVSLKKNDVLFGTGAMITRYPGNQQCRDFVNAKKELYVSASCNYAKRLVAHSIIDQVKNQTPPGRFLKQNKSSGDWEQVSDSVANEKVCRALREGAPSIRAKMTDGSITQALTKLSKDDPSLCMKLCLYRTIKELDSFRDEEFFHFTTSVLRKTERTGG